MSSSDGYSYSQSSGDSSPKTELNNEQIHALLNKLSSDEQKELTEMMRTCTTEACYNDTWVTNHWSRSRKFLPSQTTSPRSISFRSEGMAILRNYGSGVTPLLLRILCLWARVETGSNQELISFGIRYVSHNKSLQNMNFQYNLAQSATNYDEIRRQNRGGAGETSISRMQTNQREPVHAPQRAEKPNPYDYTYSVPTEETSSYGDSFTSYKPLIGETSEFQQSPRVRRPSPPISSSFTEEDSGFMSGTPSGQPSSSEKTSGYTFQ
ncbi:hypothetical protein CRE_29529 [Caenorhabditis remanei]|uniref:Uncharacterized protein n=1 Tax=Caenorhabditis remanei TaxID=31234 RepID=E3LVI2_CAERE|nr:hypothetical protein CRE_29529 [Caenorhabditis remanei]